VRKGAAALREFLARGRESNHASYGKCVTRISKNSGAGRLRTHPRVMNAITENSLSRICDSSRSSDSLLRLDIASRIPLDTDGHSLGV